MRLLKNAGSVIKRVITAWAVLVAFAVAICVGRVLSSIGSSEFMLGKFETWKDDGEVKKASRLISILSLAVVLASLVVQGATRIPKIWRKFMGFAHTPAAASDEEKVLPKIAEENPPDVLEDPMGRVGTYTYNTLSALSWASSIMTLPNNYLNGVTVFNYGLTLMHADPESAKWEHWRVAFATLIALTTFANYIIFTVDSSRKNALQIARALDKREIPINKASIATVLISASSFVTVPCQATFSTKSALETITVKFHPNVIKIMIEGLAYFSGLSAFVSQVTTQPPAVYRVLKSGFTNNSNNENVVQPCWVRPATIVVYAAGLYADGAVYGLSSFASVANICQSKWNIHTKSAKFIGINATCSLFSSVLYFSFSVVGGWHDTIAPYVKRVAVTREERLLAQPDNDDIEDDILPADGAYFRDNAPLLAAALERVSNAIVSGANNDASGSQNLPAPEAKAIPQPEFEASEELHAAARHSLSAPKGGRVSTHGLRRSRMLMFAPETHAEVVRATEPDPLVLGFNLLS